MKGPHWKQALELSLVIPDKISAIFFHTLKDTALIKCQCILPYMG